MYVCHVFIYVLGCLLLAYKLYNKCVCVFVLFYLCLLLCRINSKNSFYYYSVSFTLLFIYIDDSLMPTLILNIDIYESLNKAQLRDTLIRICVYMCKYIFLEVECRIIEVYLRSSVRILSVPREAIENTLHSREPIAISEFYAY